MHTELIKLDKAKASELFRKYKEHRAYSEPIDWEIQRAYGLIATGKVVIQALKSIKEAGLDRDFCPRLAIAPAKAANCRLRRHADGSAEMSPYDRWSHAKKNRIYFRVGTFNFPRESFPIGWNKTRDDSSDHQAMVPLIPIHLRPKRGLENYHILWEAEWSRAVPVDPMLLRRLGKADLWQVMAAWELTEVERAALSTRV